MLPALPVVMTGLEISESLNVLEKARMKARGLRMEVDDAFLE